MNEKLIRELYVKHSKKIKGGFISSRKNILKEYNESTEDEITDGQLKSFIKKNDLNSLLSNIGGKEVRSDQTVTRYEDGSYLYNRLIRLHENDLNDDKSVLRAFGLPFESWTITSAEFNLWSVESAEKRLNNYQAKIKVKPKTIKDITPSEIIDLLSESEFKFPKIEYNHNESNKTCSIFIADDHVGQIGYDFNETMSWVQEVKHHLKNVMPEKLIINFLGDVLHVDNVSKTTDRGTQLETQGTAYDMVRNAVKHVAYIVSELSFIETDIYWVMGNHSRLSEFIVMNWVADKFDNSEHIKFYVDESPRKAFILYDWLIGILHGDMPNNNKGYWLSDEFAILWGQSKYREQFEGHLHHRATRNYGSKQHHTMPTKAKQTDYEKKLGYDNYRPNIEVHTYFKDSVQKEIKTF